MRTDIFFLRGVYSTVRNQLATSPTPIYLYRITVETELSFYKKFANTEVKGVCHADELGYLFKTLVTPNIEPDSLEEKTIKRMTRLWANFARYGNPNPIKKDPLIPVVWNPVRKGEFHFLNIGEELTVGVNPEAERMKFWDEIYGMTEATSKL